MRKDKIAIIVGLISTLVVLGVIVYSIRFLAGIISDARSGDAIIPPAVQEFNLKEAEQLGLDKVSVSELLIEPILDGVPSTSEDALDL